MIHLTVGLLFSAIHAEEINPPSLGSITAQSAGAKKAKRPTKSDSTSIQLISNFLTVVGGESAYREITTIFVTGSIREGLADRSFELIETRSGKRHLTTRWRHLGREYTKITVSDGSAVWEQQLKPKTEPLRVKTGQPAEHFAKQYWFLHPFLEDSGYIFKYGGPGRVGSRETHIVIGFDAEGEKTWFYFDQENFLLLRWGGNGEIAGTQLPRDYQASKFKRAGALLFPQSIALLADGERSGTATILSIQLNSPVPESKFEQPKRDVPLLRQVPRTL